MTNYLLPLLIVVGFTSFVPLGAFAASDFTNDPYTFAAKKVSITGTSDAREVRIVLENDNGRKIYGSRAIKVKEGEWKARITKRLKPGVYDLTLFEGKGSKRTEEATTTLTISSKKDKKSGGTLSVSGVPLLMGGTAASNASIPVAYLKVYNPGDKATSIEGFTLTENGSAPDSVVTGFATSDDKGGSRSTVSTTFKKGSAFVPLAADIAPGQIRIFTIKALLGSTAGSFGTQLKIDAADVKTSASVRGSFPIYGTTFTLGL